LERRLLFAFLLSTLLIMAYQMFYYGPRVRRADELKRAQQERLEKEQPRSPELAAEAVLQPSVDDSSLAEEATPSAEAERDGLPPAIREEVRYITVSSPLYEITLTTAGAEIVEARLLDYKTRDEPVQLVRSENEWGNGILNVKLAGENREISLSEALFDAYLGGGGSPLANGTTIRLDATSREKTIVFRAEGPQGAAIERHYTFVPDQYLVRTKIRFRSSHYPFARDIVWGFGPGMTATEYNVEDDYSSMRVTLRLGDELYKKKRGDFEEDFSGTVQWAAIQTKYFTTIVVPETPSGGRARIEGVKNENFMTAEIALPAVERGGITDQTVDVYLGPLDYERLQALGRGLEKNIDIGFEHFKILKPVSRATLWCLLATYKVIPNYGVVIILLSVLTKVLFYRLTHKSFKSMRDMQSLQPRLQALKEKHKDDRQRLSQETMKLYKESGVNPLGGCLPMLLQMPVFIALFNVLRSTIEVRRAPFFAWINDLSQQDVLFELPFSLPVIGAAVSVLPILMGGSMLLQSKIGSSITGPSSVSTQPKAFTYLLPIVFTFLFYRMPSGLVLYWLVNTVLSVGQQYYINKGADKKEAASKTQQAKADKAKQATEKSTAKPVKESNARASKHKTKKG